MKKISVFCLAFCLCLSLVLPLTAFSTPSQDDATTAPPETTQAPAPTAPQVQGSVVTEGDAAVSHGANSLDGKVPLGGSQQRLSTAKAAILYEVNTDTLIYSYQADAKVYPASLVKIMTAMLAVEEGDLSETVTVSESILSRLTSADLRTDLKAGETVTLGDLVHSMMVTSSNSAAVIIAEHLAGTETAFVERMNARAKELGCTGTNFVNSHGIPHDNQYTTARDMAKIVLAAIQSEQFREIFGAATYTIPATNLSEARNLKTTNYFISRDVVQKFYDSRVTGGKSGAASTEDRSIAFTAESGSVKLLGIVMGAKGETEEDGYSLKHHGNFEEATELMNYGFDHYTTAQILFEGKSIAQFPVENGANDVVGRPASSAFSALPAGTTVADLSWQYVLAEDLTAPVAAGDVIGAVQVWCGSVCVAQSEMISMNRAAVAVPNAEQPGKTDVTAPVDSGFVTVLKVLGIILGAVLVIGLLLFGLNMIRTAVLRARRRRRRKNRRRSR